MNFREPRVSQLPSFRSLRQITALCRDRAVLERHDLVPLRHWNIIELGSNLDPLLPGFLEHVPQRAPHPGFLQVVCLRSSVGPIVFQLPRAPHDSVLVERH